MLILLNLLQDPLPDEKRDAGGGSLIGRRWRLIRVDDEVLPDVGSGDSGDEVVRFEARVMIGFTDHVTDLNRVFSGRRVRRVSSERSGRRYTVGNGGGRGSQLGVGEGTKSGGGDDRISDVNRCRCCGGGGWTSRGGIRGTLDVGSRSRVLDLLLLSQLFELDRKWQG